MQQYHASYQNGSPKPLIQTLDWSGVEHLFQAKRVDPITREKALDSLSRGEGVRFRTGDARIEISPFRAARPCGVAGCERAAKANGPLCATHAEALELLRQEEEESSEAGAVMSEIEIGGIRIAVPAEQARLLAEAAVVEHGALDGVAGLRKRAVRTIAEQARRPGDARLVDAENRCLVEGCERTARGRRHGLCQQCRAEQLAARRAAAARAELQVCAHEGCGKEAEMAGLCMTHYRRENRGQRMDGPEAKPPRLCSIDGCKELHSAKGFCRYHANLMYKELRRQRERALREAADGTAIDLRRTAMEIGGTLRREAA